MFKSRTVLIAVLFSLLISGNFCSLHSKLYTTESSLISVSCRADLEQSFVKIGQKFYFIWHSVVSWFDAAHICRRYGGDLVVIETAEELELLSSYLINQGYDQSAWLWTSGNDLGQNRHFVSITNGLPLPYTKWSSGQPDNAGGNEHCVHLWLRDNSFKMNDWICNQKAQVICQSQNHTRCSEYYQ